jgi:hypothetical protein
MPCECRLKAHNATGYSLAGEGDLMFEVRRKISARVQAAADLDEQSPTRGFAQVVGMDTEPTQLSRTHDSSFVDKGNSRFMDRRVVAKWEPQKRGVTEACTGDCSINLDSRKGRHIRISHKNLGTVWGTTVPKREFLTRKRG